MKPASDQEFLMHGGRPFGIYLGEGCWAEHERAPRGLFHVLQAKEKAPGAMCAEPSAVAQVLRFCIGVHKGQSLAALGMDRFGTYRKPETWLKGYIKAMHAGELQGLRAYWDDDEFLVFAGGTEAIERLEVLHQRLCSGHFCIATGPVQTMDGKDFLDGLILSDLSSAPDGWLQRLEDAWQFDHDYDAWMRKHHGS